MQCGFFYIFHFRVVHSSGVCVAFFIFQNMVSLFSITNKSLGNCALSTIQTELSLLDKHPFFHNNRKFQIAQTSTSYNQFHEGKPPSSSTQDKELDKRMEGSVSLFHTPTQGVSHIDTYCNSVFRTIKQTTGAIRIHRVIFIKIVAFLKCYTPMN